MRQVQFDEAETALNAAQGLHQLTQASGNERNDLRLLGELYVEMGRSMAWKLEQVRSRRAEFEMVALDAVP